jgi:hypothetical protein
VLRLQDYPGSRIPFFSIPDPRLKTFWIPNPGSGSASKNLSFFNPKNCFYALEKMIRDPDFDFFTDPGFRGQKGIESRIRNTAAK